MNAFDISGPSITGQSKVEQAHALKGLKRTSRTAHMSKAVPSRFSQPIVSSAAQDKTNAIRNSCYFSDMGEQDRSAIDNRLSTGCKEGVNSLLSCESTGN